MDEAKFQLSAFREWMGTDLVVAPMRPGYVVTVIAIAAFVAGRCSA